MGNHRFASCGGVRNRRELDIDTSEEELHLQERQTKPIVSNMAIDDLASGEMVK